MLSLSDALGQIVEFDVTDPDKFVADVKNVVNQLSAKLTDKPKSLGIKNYCEISSMVGKACWIKRAVATEKLVARSA